MKILHTSNILTPYRPGEIVKWEDVQEGEYWSWMNNQSSWVFQRLNDSQYIVWTNVMPSRIGSCYVKGMFTPEQYKSWKHLTAIIRSDDVNNYIKGLP